MIDPGREKHSMETYLQQRSKQHEDTTQTTEGNGGGTVQRRSSVGVGGGTRGRRGGRSTGTRRGGVGGSVGLVVGQNLELDIGDLLTGVVVHLLGESGGSHRDQRAGGLVGQTVLDVVRNLGGSIGQVPGVVEGRVGDQRSAAGLRVNTGLGAVASGDAAHVQLAELLLEVVVIDQGGDSTVVIDLDEAILILLESPLVNQATGEGLGHLFAVQGLDFGEDTGLDFVAAVLGEENGEGGVGEVLGQDVVAAGLVGGITTPGVGVEAEEVGTGAGGVLHVALEVVESVHQDVPDIGSGVTDGDGAGGLLGDVVLHVTDDGTNVGGSQASGILVDHFVSGEETKNVVEGLEGLDDTKDLPVVGVGVGGPGSSAVQVAIGEGGVDIEDHVDTGGIEDRGALVVVESGLEVVHTDGVDLG